MLYALEQGPNERRIIEQCLRENRPYPKAIAEAPDLEPDLTLFYLAFWELRTTCNNGFGDGEISWLAMQEYCDRAYVTDEETREEFVDFIRSLDRCYIEWRSGKRKREQDAAARDAKRKPKGRSRP